MRRRRGTTEKGRGVEAEMISLLRFCLDGSPLPDFIRPPDRYLISRAQRAEHFNQLVG